MSKLIENGPIYSKLRFLMCWMWVLHNFAHVLEARKCEGKNNQEGKCQKDNLFWRGGIEQSCLGHICPQEWFSKARR